MSLRPLDPADVRERDLREGLERREWLRALQRHWGLTEHPKDALCSALMLYAMALEAALVRADATAPVPGQPGLRYVDPREVQHAHRRLDRWRASE